MTAVAAGVPPALERFANAHAGERVYVIGKGPSLNEHRPFDRFAGHTCFGINNVHRVFPHLDYTVMWHRETYDADAGYLREQDDFVLFYSSFHSMPPGLPNAIDLPYADEFALPGGSHSTVESWRREPGRWMFKATYVTAVKLAWWMGAARITLVGFDFSYARGATADDARLLVPIQLRKYTQDEIMELQRRSFEQLQATLAGDGVVLERLTAP